MQKKKKNRPKITMKFRILKLWKTKIAFNVIGKFRILGGKCEDFFFFFLKRQEVKEIEWKKIIRDTVSQTWLQDLAKGLWDLTRSHKSDCYLVNMACSNIVTLVLQHLTMPESQMYRCLASQVHVSVHYPGWPLSAEQNQNKGRKLKKWVCSY